jgi:hypothetical protein
MLLIVMLLTIRVEVLKLDMLILNAAVVLEMTNITPFF